MVAIRISALISLASAVILDKDDYLKKYGSLAQDKNQSDTTISTDKVEQKVTDEVVKKAEGALDTAIESLEKATNQDIPDQQEDQVKKAALEATKKAIGAGFDEIDKILQANVDTKELAELVKTAANLSLDDQIKGLADAKAIEGKEMQNEFFDGLSKTAKDAIQNIHTSIPKIQNKQIQDGVSQLFEVLQKNAQDYINMGKSATESQEEKLMQDMKDQLAQDKTLDQVSEQINGVAQGVQKVM